MRVSEPDTLRTSAFTGSPGRLAVNALKHAFRDRTCGEVVVSLRTESEGCVRLSLRYDGPGLPPGLDWRKSPSLGLRLVQMLTGQLNGTIETRAEPGTEFVLTFELPTKTP